MNRLSNTLTKPHSLEWGVRFLYLAVLWLWASWWYADAFRMAYEYSFFVADTSQMQFLLQQPMGYIAALGRCFLLLMRYTWLGGLVLATLLCTATFALASMMRLRPKWLWVAALPAMAWTTWVAWLGLNLYFQAEPGLPFGLLLVAWLCIMVVYLIVPKRKKSEADTNHPRHIAALAFPFIGLLLTLLPTMLTTQLRHPYLRPVTKMQVQMMQQDWDGMAATAHANAELSYRPLAAYYAIALVHTGHLTDQMFDIRLEYDTLYLKRYGGQADNGTDYYIIDCNYHAGLIRPAMHNAMEHLTMQGPTLYSLKHLAKLSIAEMDWRLARKYLHILRQHPFEQDFVDRYSAMLDNPDAIQSDAEMATVLKTRPTRDDFEGMYQPPVFLGYNAVRMEFPSAEALMQSLMVNLYSKRMPDFLFRAQPLVGATPPKAISEGLITQAIKNQAILQAFPMLNLDMQSYRSFLSTVRNELTDRPAHARELFDRWRGYYPYYYFFGNLRATRPTKKQEAAGVN